MTLKLDYDILYKKYYYNNDYKSKNDDYNFAKNEEKKLPFIWQLRKETLI